MSEETFDNKKKIKSIIVPLIGLILFDIIFIVYIFDEIFLSALGTLVSVTAFFTFLMYEYGKNIKRKFERKKEISIYRRNLILKLNGTLSIIRWTIETYHTYGVATGFPTNRRIGNRTLGSFRKTQFDDYKVYYDEIKYFGQFANLYFLFF